VTAPEITRHGDEWSLVWHEHGVAFGIDHLREGGEGLHAEIIVQSIADGQDGRMHGPAKLNLLATRSQTELANALAKKDANVPWLALVTAACARVTKDYRTPTPTLDLSEVDITGGVPSLVPGFLPEDETTILYGDGESAKSLTALRIAISCHFGPNLALPWGVRPARGVNVLYLDWETTPKTVASRLDRLCRGLGGDRPPIAYRQMLRPLEDEVGALRFQISREKIGLVIVDSIGYACNGALVEDQTARAAMNALRQLPCTRLVVAHVSAESARSAAGSARPFGSTFFWNSMRSGWEMRRAQDQPAGDRLDLGLYHRKVNDGERSKPIALEVAFRDGEDGPEIVYARGQMADTPELAQRLTLSERLYAALRSGERDTKELVEATGDKEDSVIRTLKKMPNVIRLNPGEVGRGAVARWGLYAS
jgi:hypothetical protein